MTTNRSKKYVTFAIFNDVMPIYYKLNRDFWYNSQEITYALMTSRAEVQMLMLRNSSMSVDDAVRLLFQPNNIKYDNSYFTPNQ